MHGCWMRAGPTAPTRIVVGSSTTIPQLGCGTRETRLFGLWKLLMRSARRILVISRRGGGLIMNSPECFKLAEDQRNPSCYEAPEQASLDMAYIARQHPHL